jgi:hypothetical protein
MEVLGVDLNEPLPFAGNSALFKNGVNGAGRLAGAAINAECGIYEILLVFFGGMYAVDWTDIYAGCILLADAGLSNDIGHSGVPSFSKREVSSPPGVETYSNAILFGASKARCSPQRETVVWPFVK